MDKLKTKITSTLTVTSFMSTPNMRTYSVPETIKRIINLTENLTVFWANADGWAPIEAAEMLTKSRLDWQLSLANQLPLFKSKKNSETGRLILAWATLGSLTEGALKLFLSVYFKVYHEENLIDELKQFKDKKGNVIGPDDLMLEKLRVFFATKVLPKNAKEIWKNSGETDWLEWILKIQQRRNAIHAFKNKDIGSFNDFHAELKNYLIFLRKINNSLPYPDDNFRPIEHFCSNEFTEIEVHLNQGLIRGIITGGKLLVTSKKNGQYLKEYLKYQESIVIMKDLPGKPSGEKRQLGHISTSLNIKLYD